jgi:hypothetical protein
MFYAGLNSLLTGDAPLMATLGEAPRPLVLPERPAYPSLTYQDITSLDRYTLDGKSGQQKRVQFDAWSPRYAECKAVTHALRNLLSGFTGTLSEGTRVLGAYRENEIDDWGFDGRAFRITAEYRFLIVEP